MTTYAVGDKVAILEDRRGGVDFPCGEMTVTVIQNVPKASWYGAAHKQWIETDRHRGSFSAYYVDPEAKLGDYSEFADHDD